MSGEWSRTRISALLLLIVATHLGLGLAYASLTPPWQTPDEPAHYNYVKWLVEKRRLPVLRMGDYDGQYLEEIKSRKFPPDMAIDSIRYESHQPPLYYLMVSPLYSVTRTLPIRTQVVILRCFSVLAGAATVLVAYALTSELLPYRPAIALGASAFVAFVPMHIAMNASINNDALANLLLALVIWQVFHLVRTDVSWWRKLAVGVGAGLALLTKTTNYVLLPLVGAALLWRFLRRSAVSRRTRWVGLLADGGLILGVAVLLAAPYMIRNWLVYGPGDLFAWGRHDEVVLGQLTTRELLSRTSAWSLVRAFVRTTHQSFWAQFGWMGILVDRRIYDALAWLSGAVAIGALVAVIDVWKDRRHANCLEYAAVGLAVFWTVVTFTAYLWYNTKFVQHQGRYLFGALIPIGILFALGLEGLLKGKADRIMAMLLGASVVVHLGVGVLAGSFNRFAIVISLAGLLYFLLRPRLPRWTSEVSTVAVYVGLALLDVVCLWAFIVPYFAA